MMIFQQIPVGPMKNFAYILGDDKTGIAAVVDPAWEVEKILEIVRAFNLNIQYVINTHTHSDHSSGNEMVIAKTGAKLVTHFKAKLQGDLNVKDGDEIYLGVTRIKFIHTPGHSPDSISILVRGKLITGDVLYVGECGRVDITGGNPDQLYDSLFNKLLSLDDDIEVYPGHDYGKTSSSTIGYERRHNYTLKPRDRKEFIEFMNEP